MMNSNLNYTPIGKISQKILTKSAKRLRNNLTSAEKKLWKVLRYKSLGYEFLTQSPLFKYIPDFYCPDLKFVIEVDGYQHNYPEIKEKDLQRDLFLEQNGIVVLRVSNDDIFKRFGDVIKEILRIGNLIGRLANPK